MGSCASVTPPMCHFSLTDSWKICGLTGKIPSFLQSSSKFPLSLSKKWHFSKYAQLSAAEELFQSVSEGLFSRFSWVSHKVKRWFESDWEREMEGLPDWKMDRDRRMLVFQKPKRRENLGQHSSLTHNVQTLGKVWEAGPGRVKQMMLTTTHDYIQIPD